MEEKVVAVDIQDEETFTREERESRKTVKTISIEEYNALEDKQNVYVKSLRTNMGNRYEMVNEEGCKHIRGVFTLSSGDCVMWWIFYDNGNENTNGEYYYTKMPTEKKDSDVLFSVHGLCTDRRKVKLEAHGCIDTEDIDAYEKFQNFISEKGQKQVVDEVWEKILTRFQPILDTSFTLRQFKTYIETGNLFETPEERKTVEQQLLEKRKAREAREERNKKINDEISFLDAQIRKMSQERKQLAKKLEPKEKMSHSDEYEL